MNLHTKDLKELCSWLYHKLITAYVTWIVNKYMDKTEKARDENLRNLGIKNELAPCDHDMVMHNFSSTHISGKG